MRPVPVYEVRDDLVAARGPGGRDVGNRPWRVILTALFCVLLVSVAAGLAYVLAARGPEVHGARAQLRYALDASVPTNGADRTLNSHMLAIRSTAVLERAAPQVGLSVDQLRAAVHPRVVPNSDVVEIEGRASDGDGAQRIVQAVLDAYLALRPDDPARNDAKTFLDGQVAAIDKRLADIDAQVAALGTRPDPAALQRLTTARDVAVAERNRVDQARLDWSLKSLSSSDVTVLTAPYVLDAPVEPRPARAAALAALVAAVVAAGAAYLLLRRPALR